MGVHRIFRRSIDIEAAVGGEDAPKSLEGNLLRAKVGVALGEEERQPRRAVEAVGCG